MKKILTLILAGAAGAALAQPTPVGLWRSSDDKTGEAKAEIRIVETGGTLSGRIEKSLKKDGKPTCEVCTDERKNQPIQGLEIIRGVMRKQGEDVWEQGRILDPENGKEYKVRIESVDGGSKLQVRGYIGPFYRTQVWTRIQ